MMSPARMTCMPISPRLRGQIIGHPHTQTAAPHGFSSVGPDRRMPFPLHRPHQLEVRRLLDQSDEPRAHAPAGPNHHDLDLPLPFHHPSLRKTTPPLRINSNPPHSTLLTTI